MKKANDYIIGVNYFSGWWRQAPNKYVVHGNRDWRLDYPERIALLGCYNDQETMDAEIIVASKYGIDYFQMLWYVQSPERHLHGDKLNFGLSQFINSKENHKMGFMVEICNHPPFEILDAELWNESCKEWVDYMKHPKYLRIGGKAVIKIHGYKYFFEQCDSNVSVVSQRITLLREMAKAEGVGDLLVGAGSVPSYLVQENWGDGVGIFDFASTYMDVPDLPVTENDYPYEELLKPAEKSWTEISNNYPVPYIPYLPSGWNPRPWRDSRASFKLPNGNEWEDALRRLKKAIDNNPKLRLPDNTPSGQKIFNIYAWNEFAEGGIIAPVIGDNYMKLEKLKSVFAESEMEINFKGQEGIYVKKSKEI